MAAPETSTAGDKAVFIYHIFLMATTRFAQVHRVQKEFCYQTTKHIN